MKNFWARTASFYREKKHDHYLRKLSEELGAGRDPELVVPSVSWRRLSLIRQGYIGQGADMLLDGDEIWVLYGDATCHILREDEDGKHLSIGEAYVDDFMQGEAIEMMNQGLLEERVVVLT